jgi:hypothetical protein
MLQKYKPQDMPDMTAMHAGNYQREVSRLLSMWGVPPDRTQHMVRVANAWGRFVLCLPDSERKQVAQGRYLGAMASFEASGAYAASLQDSAQRQPEGLVIIVTPHTRMVHVAQHVAAHIAGGVLVKNACEALDQAQLRLMAECGGVIFATVTDPSTIKVRSCPLNPHIHGSLARHPTMTSSRS